MSSYKFPVVHKEKAYQLLGRGKLFLALSSERISPINFFIFLVLGTEPRALHKLDKHSKSELCAQSLLFYFLRQGLMKLPMLVLPCLSHTTMPRAH